MPKSAIAWRFKNVLVQIILFQEMNTHRESSGHIENIALQDIDEERSNRNQDGGTGPKNIEQH